MSLKFIYPFNSRLFLLHFLLQLRFIVAAIALIIVLIPLAPFLIVHLFVFNLLLFVYFIHQSPFIFIRQLIFLNELFLKHLSFPLQLFLILMPSIFRFRSKLIYLIRLLKL